MSIRAATWPSGTRIVWRGLSWGQYREVHSHQGPPAEKALKVYQYCVTEGLAPEQIPAGIMMWLYQYEMENSPFSGSFRAISGPLQKYREKITGTYLLSAQAFIASVFKIPFEKMDEWDTETFLTRLAQAEFVSGVPLNPVDPTTTAKGASGNKMETRRPKKPLTEVQQIALERHNDRSNIKGSRKTH